MPPWAESTNGEVSSETEPEEPLDSPMPVPGPSTQLAAQALVDLQVGDSDSAPGAPAEIYEDYNNWNRSRSQSPEMLPPVIGQDPELQDGPGLDEKKQRRLSFSDIVRESDTADSLSGSVFSASSPDLPLSALPIANEQAAAVSPLKLKITLPPMSQVRKKKSAAPLAGTPRKPGAHLSPSPQKSDRLKLALKAHSLRKRHAQPLLHEPSRSPCKITLAGSSAVTARAKRARANRPDFEGAIAHLSTPWTSPNAKPLLPENKSSHGDAPEAEKKVAKKSGPGRPKKSESEEELVQWSVAAYLEVEHFEEVKKVGRVKKTVIESRVWRGGPVTITHKTNWQSLVDAIARCADVRKENIDVSSLAWRVAPSVGTKTTGGSGTLLPMTDQAGFLAFVKDGIIASRATRNFIFRMAPPVKAKRIASEVPWESVTRSRSAHATGVSAVGEESDDDVTGGQGMGGNSGKHPWKSNSLGVDDELEPIVRKLQHKYPVGCCHVHAGIRCFHHLGIDRHFELDNNRLLVWAASISNGDSGVDYNHAPLHSHFFDIKYALKVPPAASLAGPQGARVPPHVAGPYPGPSVPVPTMAAPFSGAFNPFPYPPMYGYPSPFGVMPPAGYYPPPPIYHTHPPGPIYGHGTENMDPTVPHAGPSRHPYQ